MKHLPNNVKGTHDKKRGYGYLVTLVDGSVEWHRLAWQATARSFGWTPPTLPLPAEPDPNCLNCHGTGEEPNAQFRCACRWRSPKLFG